MLIIGSKNIEQADLKKQIALELVDSKQLPYRDEQFDMAISNSLFHHLPDPLPFLRGIKRVLKPGGAILIRDLIRPADQTIMDAMVDSIGTEYSEQQKLLFRDSLHAAFTLDEVNELVQKAGIEGVKVYQSSDRHWTAERKYSQE
jgi:ubiquinone/menaquinone biosynthesis C-methylase UbiE